MDAGNEHIGGYSIHNVQCLCPTPKHCSNYNYTLNFTSARAISIDNRMDESAIWKKLHGDREITQHKAEHYLNCCM